MTRYSKEKKALENWATWETSGRLKTLIKNKKLGSLTINALKRELKRRSNATMTRSDAINRGWKGIPKGETLPRGWGWA